MKAFARYALTMSVTAILLGTVQGLFAGEGAEAVIGAVMGLVWVGWIGVMLGIPLLVVFLWFLPAVLDRVPDAPPQLVGALFSGAIWALVPVMLGTLAVATGSVEEGVNPIEGLLGLGSFMVIGAAVGFVEGWAWQRRVDAAHARVAELRA